MTHTFGAHSRARRTSPVTSLLILGLACTLSFAGTQAASAATPPAADGASASVSDDFGRSTTASIGTADVGGSWASTNGAISGTDSESAVLRLSPGAFTVNLLPDIEMRDASVSLSFWASASPTSGNGVTTSAMLRARDGYSYQARARLAPGDRVIMTISRYDGSFGKEVVLLADTVALTGVTAGEKVRLEFSATGGGEQVDLTAKVSTARATSRELAVSDRSAGRIVDAGAAGFGAYLSSRTNALELRVDEFRAVPTPPTTPQPEPTEPTPVPSDPTPVPSDPTPQPSPTDPVVSPPDSVTAGSAGAAPVGSTTYSVPSNAKYVTAGGAASGTGSSATPYRSLSYAISKAPSGSTLVLRKGTYHESVVIPFGKKLTIQPYPNEAVWLDGSSTLSEWKSSGGRWISDGWTQTFDRRVSFSANKDETSRWTDAGNPFAGYPEQVWIGGAPQRQVGSLSQVVAGTFFADTTNDRLVLGSDPSGKNVQASTLRKAMTIAGTGSTVRGIGIRKYATSVNQMGTVTAEVPAITLENVVITDNAAAGLYVWSTDHVLRNVSATKNGLMGIGANDADRLQVINSDVSANNTERFKPAPVSGGMKITSSDDVVIKGSEFDDNTTNGLWFDVSSKRSTIVGNAVRDNGRYGLLYEASEVATIADNSFSGAGHTALMIYNAGTIQVWNNTFSQNSRSIWFMQDERRSGNTTTPWIVRNVTVKNNVISYGTNGCPILAQDNTNTLRGSDFKITLDSNLYHRKNASTPGNFVCWANGAAGIQSFKTLTAFQAHTGGDDRSRLLEGTMPVTASLTLTTPAASLAPGIATTIPASIADVIGAARGTAALGALTIHK